MVSYFELLCEAINLPLLVPIRATVQPARQGTPPEVVSRFLAEGKEENPAGTRGGYPRKTIQDV